MATAFQPAFQQNAFQEEGGSVAGGTVTVQIVATQEGDSGTIRIAGPSAGGAPGGRHIRGRNANMRIVYIDGIPYIGDQAYIESVLRLKRYLASLEDEEEDDS